MTEKVKRLKEDLEKQISVIEKDLEKVTKALK